MKVKLLCPILLFIISFCFSQNNKPKKGKILCDDFPLQGIEVLNLNSKITTKSDANGDFSILIADKDSLMFISKNCFYRKICMKKEDLSNPLIIHLTRKPEQLDEVIVISKITFPHIGFSQEYADQSNLEKAANNPKPIGVYDGSTSNGADFKRIADMIISLFIKPKEKPREQTPEIKFKEHVLSTNDEEFYKKTLHLKPEEVALFLEFCDADPKSKIVLENTNPLKLMDFLFDKNIEFKKLSTLEK